MKKIILILLSVLFYQNNLNAQSSINVTITDVCSYASGIYTYNGLLNGKNSYTHSIIIDGVNFGDVAIGFDNTKWVLYDAPEITVAAYINNNVPDGLLPPFTDWESVSDCSGTMTIDENLSVNDIKSFDNKVSIYPNPTKSYLIIADTANINSIFEYNIIDFVGRIVAKGISKSNEKIFVENLLDGNYIIEIRSEFGDIARKKFIKN